MEDHLIDEVVNNETLPVIETIEFLSPYWTVLFGTETYNPETFWYLFLPDIIDSIIQSLSLVIMMLSMKQTFSKSMTEHNHKI